MKKEQEGFLNIPIRIIQEDNMFHVFPNKETEKTIGKHLSACYGTGETLDEAESKFFQMMTFLTEHDRIRSNELDLWKPFQKGDWRRTGGTWFIIFGINVYFRYDKTNKKQIKGGKYIPFTKLNVSITNRWKIEKQ